MDFISVRQQFWNITARGLDVTPAMLERLRGCEERRGAEILTIILRDEIGHVAAGSRWFRYLCTRRGLDPEQAFRELVGHHMNGVVKGPLNASARRQAGFAVAELDWLVAQSQRGR